MKSMKILGVIGLLTIGAGCTPNWARENETGLLMSVSEVAGRPAGGQEGQVLFSDVSNIFNDDARLILTIFRKNPTTNLVSPLEAIRLDRYQVQYFRSDGRNVEGQDVPYRITGPLPSLVIEVPAATDITDRELIINVVRQQAKVEPPLRNLVGVFQPIPRGAVLTGGEGIITTSAEITIYGRQVSTGEPLRAVGRLQITFADFVDESL